ncbi:Myb-like DNA-binding domain containing protein [Tritrichomonas foetus]|uniref:Myb-like DNA-binding domain containing protein n=1 Tax=Tritrichomonas foetus TaxID=1144522 RepID=A0A1J4KLL9_9EUKA|nr:Myb-like DNA-binding domain containing protein [Tritrichomonas foetus]|eukprot:OHT12034.1 Myb-like DNA-binding domain containing protein [Tritrichomonas foetus]
MINYFSLDSFNDYFSLFFQFNKIHCCKMLMSNHMEIGKTQLCEEDIPIKKKNKFTPDEDKALLKLIDMNGAKKWNQLAIHMPGRTGRQCRDRYTNYLKRNLLNGEWTVEEENLLFSKVNEYGQRWSLIAKFFENRSANNIKNRWYKYQQRNSSKSYLIKGKHNCSQYGGYFERKGFPSLKEIQMSSDDMCKTSIGINEIFSYKKCDYNNEYGFTSSRVNKTDQSIQLSYSIAALIN